LSAAISYERVREQLERLRRRFSSSFPMVTLTQPPPMPRIRTPLVFMFSMTESAGSPNSK
jgi:hypothetical protein